MEEESDNQLNNNKPWLWKKGQSGNLKGRPKGKTLKEWVKDYLVCLTDEEREEFMEGIPKEIIWKMAEGNPHSTTDITSGDKPIPLLGIIKNVSDNNSNQEDTPTGEQPKEN